MEDAGGAEFGSRAVATLLVVRHAPSRARWRDGEEAGYRTATLWRLAYQTAMKRLLGLGSIWFPGD